MAATDQTYRNQRILDIVFAVSCVLMLVSIIGMFAQDYNREWKTEQRRFQDVEVALSDRAALRALPDPDEISKAEDKVKEARQEVDQNQPRIDEIDRHAGRTDAERAFHRIE